MNQQKGQVFGEYNIDTSILLGQGSFGRIFKCQRNNDSTQYYCAKVISTTVNEKALQSEKKAFGNMKELQCKNLVKMYDMIELPDQLIIIMELCDSDLFKEFYEHKKSNTWYSQQEQYNIIEQILKGSQVLVENKIIHRDIKPENILIKKIKEGDIERKIYKISDFSFCRKLQDINLKQNLTRAGTRTYCAPEIQNPGDFSGKCDIFSYGILFHQIVNKGQFPHQEYQIDNTQFINQIQKYPFKFKNPLQGEIGLILMSLIEKMIVYDQDKRINYDEIFSIFAQRQDAKSIFEIQEHFYNKYWVCKTIHEELIKISSNKIEILKIQYLISQIGLRFIEFAFAVFHQILQDLHQMFLKQEFTVLLKSINEYKEKIRQDNKYMEQKNKISKAYHQQFKLCQQNFDLIFKISDNQVLESFQGTIYEQAQTQKVSIEQFCQQLNERVQQEQNLPWFVNLQKPIQSNIKEFCKLEVFNAIQK